MNLMENDMEDQDSPIRYPLSLPAYDFSIQRVAETPMIFDVIRRRYVRLTAEEWVRQHFVQFLIHERDFPQSLIAIEMAFTYQGMARRADIVVYDRKGAPILITECKSPDIEVRQDVFDQVARYNLVLQVRYLVVTNGRNHYCCDVDLVNRTYRFLDDLPRYDEL